MTFTLSVTNKSTLLAATVALEEIILEQSKGVTVISMAEMNTLKYATTLTLVGEKYQFDLSKVDTTLWDPSHVKKGKIENMRKWLARIRVVVANGSSLTQKFKSYLRKRPIQEVPQQCKISLAALSKRLRTNKFRRNRHCNNKLHRFNTKLFYSKLSYGDCVGIRKTPPDDAAKKFWGGVLETRMNTKKKHNV